MMDIVPFSKDLVKKKFLKKIKKGQPKPSLIFYNKQILLLLHQKEKVAPNCFGAKFSYFIRKKSCPELLRG